MGLPGGSVVENPPASAGHLGSVPQSGGSPAGGNVNVNLLEEEEMSTHCSIFALEIPETEEPGGLQPMGSQRDMSERLNTYMHMNTYIHTDPHRYYICVKQTSSQLHSWNVNLL